MNTRTGFAAAVVLLLAGVLLVMQPWRKDTDSATTLKTSTASYTVHLVTNRPRAGANTFDLEIKDRDGAPSAMDEVTLQPVMPHMGHAYPPVTAAQLAPGRYRAENAVLPMSGMWRITVTLHGAHGVEQGVFPLMVK
ncbi:FixH family protein [Nonomuraea glycinis]|jgi:hypothetical protein|uniref:YtkA-like domain-containing protein n=1 Tax=Nonomuraea glycinis TaxID=2047744 RepID=A0A918A101_9ACTN|nr:FixH family protein [Nonomuraea glycinis]MCA2176683.1 FixH family protein [Nonomuraea glycinis]GGP03522.1 hypothetical protein GCM10012278_15080 [Nonomuraea glycinis]